VTETRITLLELYYDKFISDGDSITYHWDRVIKCLITSILFDSLYWPEIDGEMANSRPIGHRINNVSPAGWRG